MLPQEVAMQSGYTHRRAGAFTLIELMVVIGILALLIGILLPSLAAAREAARKARCAHNLHNAGLAFQNYANDNNQLLPNLPYVSTRSWNAIGFAANKDAFVDANDNRDGLRALFLLVKQNYETAETFICPSDKSAEAMTADEVEENYEWLRRRNNSYSYQNQRGAGLSTSSSSATLPILADRNPQLVVEAEATYDSMTPILDENMPQEWLVDKSVKESANSPNHNGTGQAVLYLGGSARFEGSPKVGLVINDVKDNIYTKHNGDDWGAPMTWSLRKDGPYSGRDAWLVP
jgi:prepilin-type N-terminal cleavage/methylation domain-containing protein